MLSLTRRPGERILIGEGIEVTVVSTARGKVTLGIAAPPHLRVYRAEVVERVQEQNRQALASDVERAVGQGRDLHFEEGLFGWPNHRRFLLCDLDDDNPIRCLVSVEDPSLRLYVIDAETWPDYPLAEALSDSAEDEDVGVALVVRVPKNGDPATVNLRAPLVVGLTSRRGRQVILPRSDLPVDAPLPQVEPVAATG